LCDKCKEKVEKYSPFCFICGDNNEKYKIHKECKKKENFLLDRVIIFTKYKNKKIAKLIKNAKYYSKKDIFEDF
jgi:predicted amidophosphoribosyltransferase